MQKFIKILNKREINYSIENDNLTVGDYLDLRGTNITSLPDNLTVGGSLDLRGTNITSLPDNLTVGGSLDLSETNIKNKAQEKQKVKNLPDNFWNKLREFKLKIRLSLNLDLKLQWKNGLYRKIDGMFCKIIKQRKNIFEVEIGNKKAYIFHKNNIFAHGKTIKQAYRDWLFKTSDRDVSKYENLNPNEIKDLNFWVIAYRTITGACSFGTENYLENNKELYKDKMTLKEVIEATKGQYGHNTFKEFFEA